MNVVTQQVQSWSRELLHRGRVAACRARVRYRHVCICVIASVREARAMSTWHAPKKARGWGGIYRSSVVCMAPWRIMARRACSAPFL